MTPSEPQTDRGCRFPIGVLGEVCHIAAERHTAAEVARWPELPAHEYQAPREAQGIPPSEALRAALERYGHHLPECAYIQPVDETPWRSVRCTCTPEKWWGDHEAGCPRAEAFKSFMAALVVPDCDCGLAAALVATPSGGIPLIDVEVLGLSAEQTRNLRRHLIARQQTLGEWIGDVLFDLRMGRPDGIEYPPALASESSPAEEGAE